MCATLLWTSLRFPKIDKPLVVYRFYCMALFHSQTRRHMINICKTCPFLNLGVTIGNLNSISPVLLRNRCLYVYVAVRNEIGLWYLSITNVLSSKYNDFGLNSYGKMNVSRFSPCKCIMNQIWSCSKGGQGQPRIIYNLCIFGRAYISYATYQVIRPFGSREEKTLKGFYRILAWWPFWSFDHLNKLSSPHPKKSL